MDLFLVAPSSLPNAAVFFEQTFGSPPSSVLFFPGPTGSGWDSATVQGVIFHLFDPAQGGFGNPAVENFLRTVFPDKPLHALRAWCETPQNEDIVPFVRDELLPALADATNGVIAEETVVVYRAGDAKERAGGECKAFRALVDRQINLRSQPPSKAEDWSDL